MFKNSISILLIATLFSACSSVNIQTLAKEKSTPSWVNKLPIDNSNNYYVVSNGVDRKDAIVKGLNEIASRVSISIESKMSSNTFASYKNKDALEYHKDVQQNIQNSVKKINFSNYKIEKEYKSANGVTLLLSVDRVKLANSMKEPIDEKISEIEIAFKKSYSNIVIKLKTLLNSTQDLEELSKNLDLISSINPALDIKKTKRALSKIESSLDEFKESISFRVNSKNSKYNSIVKDYILQKGYRVDSKTKETIEIVIDEKNTNLKALDNYVIKSEVLITLRSNYRVLSMKSLKFASKSKSSYYQAKNFITNNFKNKMLNEGVLSKLLGF